MNNQRRKEIEKIREQIELLMQGVERLKDEEQDYYDNMPESFQYGDKGQKAESAIDSLDSAYSSLDDALNYLNESTE